MKDSSTSSPGEQTNSGISCNSQNFGDDVDTSRAASEQHAHITENGAYLSSLSELAGYSFASTTKALEAALKLIVDQLGLRSSFITRITREECQKEILMAYNQAGGSDIPTRGSLELPRTF